MKRALSNLIFAVRMFRQHPLTRDHFFSTAWRYAKWQVGSRLVPGPVVVPWVGPCRLVMEPAMWGATMNHYCGLQDFESMVFVIHVLRPEDLFLDVGANVGAYTVLASGLAGARTIAVEPGLEAATALRTNVRLNDLSSRVEIHPEAVGATPGTVQFTKGLDTMNHVAAASEPAAGHRQVSLTTIDLLLHGRCAQLIKLDTEGFETPAVKGATDTIANPGLLGWIVELEGHGRRYGFDETALHDRFIEAGFAPHTYLPFERSLNAAREDPRPQGNVLYLRVNRLDEIRRRIASAPPCHVLGKRF